ncbi:TPA: hypothetical protein QCG56_003519 [Enterobacter cancerogenus]|nr:hypothetical protein [Enterobacter cancerogenus]HDR2166629.1 hypothetical protein [Enterobacter cancerogenus]HDR2269211.1 hypothetical protein [Enterobacter cancerogenus]
MALKLYGETFFNCGAAVIAPSSVDIESHNSKMENCGVGYGIYSSAEELDSLKNIAEKHTQEIEQLTNTLKQTKPELRRKVLTGSAIFATLAGASNATTVIQFLIDHYPSLEKLLS